MASDFKNTIRIASRASDLALAQANTVKQQLVKLMPNHKISILKIATSGDKDKTRKAFTKHPIGIFVKQIENALLNDKADIAVHSLKDLPSTDTFNLTIGAYTRRYSPHDILVSKKLNPIQTLRKGAIIGTGSYRRQCQIQSIRSDFKIVSIRGNVPTRLKMVESGKLDAVILAQAGINRLQLDGFLHQYRLPLSKSIPAAGQGTLAIQVKTSNATLLKLIRRALNHAKTESESLAERECMKQLQAGCRVPVAIYAYSKKNEMTLWGTVYSPDGKKITVKEKGFITQPKRVATRVAKKLNKLGASEILTSWRALGYE